MQSNYANQGMRLVGVQPSVESTIVVVGSGRGGTSMCAGVLQRLRVYMGRDAKAPTYEDLYLSSALEENRFDDANRIITEYNSAHATWGYKRPSALSHIDFLHNHLRRPYYIFVFRDILAVSLRENVSMDEPLPRALQTTLQSYKTILAFIDRTNPNGLLVSYEKSLLNPEAFVESVSSLLSARPPALARTDAINFIKPSPTEYVIGTSTSGLVGYLDVANRSKIAGWAAFNRTAKPVSISIYANDEFVAKVTPSFHREDVARKKLHPTGHCGFEIDSRELALSPGDVISARFSETGSELRNSPRIVA